MRMKRFSAYHSYPKILVLTAMLMSGFPLFAQETGQEENPVVQEQTQDKSRKEELTDTTTFLGFLRNCDFYAGFLGGGVTAIGDQWGKYFTTTGGGSTFECKFPIPYLGFTLHEINDFFVPARNEIRFNMDVIIDMGLYMDFKLADWFILHPELTYGVCVTYRDTIPEETGNKHSVDQVAQVTLDCRFAMDAKGYSRFLWCFAPYYRIQQYRDQCLHYAGFRMSTVVKLGSVNSLFSNGRTDRELELYR